MLWYSYIRKMANCKSTYERNFWKIGAISSSKQVCDSRIICRQWSAELRTLNGGPRRAFYFQKGWGAELRDELTRELANIQTARQKMMLSTEGKWWCPYLIKIYVKILEVFILKADVMPILRTEEIVILTFPWVLCEICVHDMNSSLRTWSFDRST